MDRYSRTEEFYRSELTLFCGNLSRLNGLVAVMNISLFFLTGLVARGYYFTYISLICVALVGIGLIVPTLRLKDLWYYCIFLLIECVAVLFLISSIVHMVRTTPLHP